MNKTVSIIGGDMRQLTVARALAADGCDVKIYGLGDTQHVGLENAEEVCSALSSEIIILPVPVTFDNITVNMPLSDIRLQLCELSQLLRRDSKVFGGRLPAGFSEQLSERGISHYDYMTRGELAIRNAVPTAEGAIEIAIAETPITLHGSDCLVLGYGRVGSALARSLKALGANTAAAARKYADLARIEGDGHTPLTIKAAKEHISGFDIIFNTVPSLVLDAKTLSGVSHSTLIIDLASKPGGIDFERAKQLGLRVIWALSLPGRVAPVTAGLIIKDTIKHIIDEEDTSHGTRT